jgi:MFS family permease
MPYNHHQFLHFFHNRELGELYASIAIRSFALSLIGIFIPIYLVQQGFAISTVFVYYSIVAITHALGTFPAAKVSSRFGLKHVILFSIPLLVLGLISLYAVSFLGVWFYAVPVVFGLSNAFFWTGYHCDFAKFSDRKNRGSEVGVARIITLVFHATGPIIGGVLLTFFGFNIVFLSVSVLLFVSTVPLFYSKDPHTKVKFSFERVFKGQKFSDVLSYVGFGMERVIGYVVWPIFIFFFIFNEKYTSLGGVATLTLVMASISVFLIGKFTNKHRRKVLKIGAVGNGLVWFAKTFVVTPVQVFVADAFYGITQSAMMVSFDTLTYDKANKEKDLIKYIVFREFTINVSRAVFFLVMVFVVDLTVGFVFGGTIGSLLQLFF